MKYPGKTFEINGQPLSGVRQFAASGSVIAIAFFANKDNLKLFENKAEEKELKIVDGTDEPMIKKVVIKKVKYHAFTNYPETYYVSFTVRS